MQILLLIALSTQLVICASTDELVFAITMWRHGDRTPVEPYPKDPYSSPDDWPVGFGQLTSRGKRMQYNLGRYLRGRYKTLIGDSYDPNAVYIRSTDVDRTLMSAEANLAGLFPPEGNQVWNPTIPWQPIPVHTVPKEEDAMLSEHAVCDRAAKAVDEVLASPEMKKLDEENAELFAYLEKHSGEPVKNILTVDFLYDTLYIEQLYNKTLPAWTSSVFPDKMRRLRNLSFKLDSWTDELKRLKGGPLIEDVVKRMKNASMSLKVETRQKLILYSGHDTTLATFMNSLGMFDGIAPPYASAIMVELYKTQKNEFYVQFWYRNDTSSEPHLLTVEGCSENCPLEKLDRVTQHLRPQNWKRECQDKSEDDAVMRFVTNFSFFIAISLLIILAIAVCIHIVRSLKNRRLDTSNYIPVQP